MWAFLQMVSVSVRFLLGRSQLCFHSKEKLIPPLKSCKMAVSNNSAHMPRESGKPTACGSKFIQAG